TTSERKLSTDVYLAAQSTATVVILMGMSKLNEIVTIFKKFNKSEVPTAIIQNGTTKNEKLGLGTISTIEEVVAQKKISSPAIIVIGEVVKESTKLRSYYESLNLAV
ncbi:MAG: uroporphyrinogen-III C-methyltransferase, partial [Lutibacter sp.]